MSAFDKDRFLYIEQSLGYIKYEYGLWLYR